MEHETRPRRSLAEKLAALPDAERQQVLAALTHKDFAALLHDWRFWARPQQLPPADDEWFCWLILAGRGFGKTRSGAEWVRMQVERAGMPIRVALIAETWHDARSVMIEGESGILSCARPDFRPRFEPSKRRLVWPNGAVAGIYSADAPDQLRGPQHHVAWGDELAKWRHAETTWANLLMGLRLGVRPRVCITTTPRPIGLLKELMKDPTTRVTRGSTFDNRANLSPTFLRQMAERYGGTRLGRQELEAEILEDLPGALWRRETLDRARVRRAPDLERLVVAIDPPVTSGSAADACGIVLAGRAADGHAYVLADCTLEGATPLAWARHAVTLYSLHRADRIVAEVNNGGELIELLIRQVDPQASFRALRARRGKVVRAEPVAALYERGLVHHVGAMTQLEDQLCGFVSGRGWTGPGSPDRADALVWALTDLMLEDGGEPRLRPI